MASYDTRVAKYLALLVRAIDDQTLMGTTKSDQTIASVVKNIEARKRIIDNHDKR